MTGQSDTTSTRSVVYIPVIHSRAEIGTLARSMRRLITQKVGRQGWERSEAVIAHLWEAIRQAIDSWRLPWERVRLYQDGLPCCGREAEIVADLARAGSVNHQLLLSLMQKGATLMGTESPDLVLEEYRLAQQILAARDPNEAARRHARHEARRRTLLAQRDAYIARRLNESLRVSETGLLFLGMLHCLDSDLAKDMRVSYPFGRPAHSGTQTR